MKITKIVKPLLFSSLILGSMLATHDEVDALTDSSLWKQVVIGQKVKPE